MEFTTVCNQTSLNEPVFFLFEKIALFVCLMIEFFQVDWFSGHQLHSSKRDLQNKAILDDQGKNHLDYGM